MKRLGFFSIAFLVLFSLAYYAFDRLGGNNPIEVELIESTPPTLVGRLFKGQPQDAKLGETFQSIETLQSLNPGKKIHTIYFEEPGGKLDTMEVFVGLDLPFGTDEFETFTFNESRYLLAKIKANQWVMPGPGKVKAKLKEVAKERNLSLSGVFIDRIISDTEVHVLSPIK